MIFLLLIFFWSFFILYFWKNYPLFNDALKILFLLKSITSVVFIYVYTHWYSGDLNEYLSISKQWSQMNLKEVLKDFIFEYDYNDPSPRKTFFSKLFFLTYLLSFKNIYLLSFLFSQLSFIMIFESYKYLKAKNSSIYVTYTLAFFVPSILFWTSGPNKECITVPAFCFILFFLRYFKFSDIKVFGPLLVFLVSLYFVCQLRYFYLPFLIMFFWVFQLEKHSRNILFWIISMGSFLSYVSLQNYLEPQFRFSIIQELIFDNYHLMKDLSTSGNYIEIDFPDSSIKSLFLAGLISLKGIFFISSKNVFLALISLENFLIFLLLVYTIWNDKRTFLRNYLFYCIIILLEMVFYNLVSPNYGSLSRYRLVYWVLIAWYILEQQKSLLDFRRLFNH